MRHLGVSQEEAKAYFEVHSSTFDVAGINLPPSVSPGQFNLVELSKLMGWGKLFRRIVGSQLAAEK